jgi:tetratricopeptide (TPR) repeat protein
MIAEKLQAAYNLGRYDEAIKLAMQIIANNESEDALYGYEMVIRSLIQKDEYEKALEVTKKALKHYPAEHYLFYLKADIKRLQNKPKEALEFIKQALSFDSNKAYYYTMLGDILYDMGSYIKAKEAIERALFIDSHDEDALISLALITNALENPVIACQIIAKVLKANPHNTSALNIQAKLCSANLTLENNLLKNLLFLNPFDGYSKKEQKAIQRYYKIAPLLMIGYLVYALMIWLEYPHDEFISIITLLLIGSYVYRDYRLSLPFFGMVIVFTGDVSWSEWYLVPLVALWYYFLGWFFSNIFKNIIYKFRSK